MESDIICPKCGFEQQDGIECRKCGIVFSKFDPDRHGAFPVSPIPDESINNIGSDNLDDETERWIYGSGKYALIALMAFFFFYMVIKRTGWCFLDHVNLPFHEFGHILFSPFGHTMYFLGGTISQLMWPAILLGYFLKRREWLSSSFCLFWFGENFLNISKYVADARAMSLPLVGGGVHDWNTLLGKWGALKYDQTIAKILFAIGVIIMVVSMVWAFFAKPVKTVN